MTTPWAVSMTEMTSSNIVRRRMHDSRAIHDDIDGPTSDADAAGKCSGDLGIDAYPLVPE